MRLSYASAADEKSAGAALKAAPKQGVQFSNAAFGELSDECLMMFRRNKAWEDFDPASLNNEIVIAPAKINSAHFLHSKTPTFCTIIKRELLQSHDAMGNAVELNVAFSRGEIVKQQNSTSSPSKKLLQSEGVF